MCGRLSQSNELTWRELWELLGGSLEPPRHIPSWNVGPTGSLACVTSGPQLVVMQWGFTSPELRHSSGGPQFNSRWEILERHAREACTERRCLVAADGFYHFLSEGRRKRPFRFEAPDGGALLLAGVWEPGAARDGGPAVSVLTRAAQGEVAQFHKRSPVIVPPDLARSYLDAGRPYAELREALSGYEPSLSVFPVTPKVNRVGYSGDDCGRALQDAEPTQPELPFGCIDD